MQSPGLLLLALAAAVPPLCVRAQQTPVRIPGQTDPPPPELTKVAPNVWRLAGYDAWSGLHYVRVLLVTAPDANAAVPDLSRPTLTGQCTEDVKGKLAFELFANFGSVPDANFYPPWHSTGPEDRFAPPTDKVTVTMEFLGYTKVKPFHQQFEQVVAPGPQQLRYMNPGSQSRNMEPPAFLLRYLKALPTLRLSAAGKSAEFETANWITALHKEPLCAASGA